MAIRECGECTVCCLLTHIPQLNKPVYKLCEYCDEDAGCNQYDARPEACKKYLCVWRIEELSESLRPDKCHVMFERLPGNSTYVGLVQPGYEKRWLTQEVQKFTNDKLKKGSAVIVNAVGRKFIKCPDGIKPQKVINDLKTTYAKYIAGF